MNGKPTCTILLCEDKQHLMLITKTLKRYGWNTTEDKFIARLAGRKDAKQHVRRNYPKYLKAFRADSNKKSVALLVVIDGDKVGYEQRIQELRKSCIDDKREAIERIADRKPGERVAVFVPTRCIETWIYYLADIPVQNGQVNERDEYPCKDGKRKAMPETKSAAQELATLFREKRSKNHSLADALPSIRTAHGEFQRLTQGL